MEVMRLLIGQGGERICGFSIMRFYDEHGRFPLVELKKFPDISIAQWNLCHRCNLLPDARRRLKRLCLFICTAWAGRWFSDQRFRVADFTDLEEASEPYQAALECLRRNWKQEPSRIYSPRSNQCCERAIKMMKEIHASRKDKSNAPLLFILANQH